MFIETAASKTFYKRELERKIKREVETRNLKKKGYVKKKGRFKQGYFWSKKNNKKLIFRSTYEFAYFNLLERDSNVVSYAVEPYEIPYLCQKGTKNYIPDLLVLYQDGSMEMIEIKPSDQLDNVVVKQKARAAKSYIKRHLPNTTFKFITEKDIFHKEADYKKLVKKLRV